MREPLLEKGQIHLHMPAPILDEDNRNHGHLYYSCNVDCSWSNPYTVLPCSEHQEQSDHQKQFWCRHQPQYLYYTLRSVVMLWEDNLEVKVPAAFDR